ncbi:DivIVA domain-containing protein [Micromonospora thermarum]|uniref:DivIVA domain-containing protein n=1 Tax=Micromonospora thermarum TaxID=2720024 RepID=A0ABX0ZF48_9ACTN|nr:DivIVA domain-containing protein [Micromonospora thermarum]NJP35594.1 DivIVA domain-containing protein [Micromonospora thermarum]
MGQVLLLLVVALTVAAVVFGVTVLVTGRDPGLAPAEPDGKAVPLPGTRPLRESDVGEVRFDTALRGYRMAQVDQAMRRAAYDIGYKSELIGVLEAEVAALREGRTAEADALRSAREKAAGAQPDATALPPADPDDTGTPTVSPADTRLPATDRSDAPADPTDRVTTPADPTDPTTAPADEAEGTSAPADAADRTSGPADAADRNGAPAGAARTGQLGEHGPVVRSEPA